MTEGARKEMREQGLLGARRVFVGRADDAAAAVYLLDSKGKLRIRLMVDAKNAPRLEFLDEAGPVTRSFTDAAEPPQR